MKQLKLILLLLLLLPLATPAQHIQTDFQTDFETAQTLSQQEGKPIMLVFSGSDWCKPCILMKKKILETPAFAAFQQENLVVLNLDFPYQKRNRLSEAQTQHNEALAATYNPAGDFPLVLLLNPDLSVARRISYATHMQPEAFLKEIETVLPVIR